MSNEYKSRVYTDRPERCSNDDEERTIKYRATQEHHFFDRFDNLVVSAVSMNHKSISDIIREMGVRRSTLYTYRNRKTLPSTKTLLKIADYFGVSTDYLLGREGYELE